ncbi:DUF3180 family protein [Leucobacter triazinivorans]|uniref:DUF3180 family protein n=1 Tax=Leucobacter triazinivorans TaxID=1784719 RepID=A0A4P6KE49_9MICO|nr:DUF3180 family protein [Leucobacter triazinivorans]QBE48380.1 DUF3180 family protein [Leucobacter triazinivorans]
MRRIERSSPLLTLVVGIGGAVLGVLVQIALSNRGSPPLVPPFSLPASLALIAVVLLVFGIRLRRALRRGPGAVNPFQAVRLLAAARAGQLVGAALGGFGGGLAIAVLGRSVPAPPQTWLPMLLVLLAGAVLIGCAVYAERCCRVPPGDDAEDTGTDPEPGPADQAAFRRP